MKRKTTTRLLGAAMVAAAMTPWLGGGPAAAVTPEEADIFVKQSQVPTTAAQFGNKVTDCPGFVASEPFDYFHFVLDGNAYSFVELTAEFDTGDVTITTFGPPSDKHAYVKVPAGSVLENAYANITPDDDGQPADFQLSHVCVGTPTTSTTSSAPVTTSSSAPVTTTSSAPVTTTSSAPVTTTSSAPVTTTSSAPVTTSSAPVTTTSSAPVSVLPTQATSEAEETDVAVEGTKTGGELAATGAGMSLGMAIAISLGLLLAGAALMFAPRHLAVERGSHRRRH